MSASSPPSPPGRGPAAGASGRGGARRTPPPELTHREALWYARRVEDGALLVLRLSDGEELTGSLDWYDRSAYRLRLPDGGHLVVQKSAVQTLRMA